MMSVEALKCTVPLDAQSHGLHVFFSLLFLPFRMPRIECAKEGMLPHTRYKEPIAT